MTICWNACISECVWTSRVLPGPFRQAVHAAHGERLRRLCILTKKCTAGLIGTKTQFIGENSYEYGTLPSEVARSHRGQGGGAVDNRYAQACKTVTGRADGLQGPLASLRGARRHHSTNYPLTYSAIYDLPTWKIVGQESNTPCRAQNVRRLVAQYHPAANPKKAKGIWNTSHSFPIGSHHRSSTPG